MILLLKTKTNKRGLNKCAITLLQYTAFWMTFSRP